MTHNKYAFGGFNKELMARAMARDAEVSVKTAIEMCNYLRNRKLQQAKKLLGEVLEKKRAIPFKRFTDGVGHRKGAIAAGRFPQKGSRVLLSLLESAETNAQLKGLSTGELTIIHICAHKAHSPVHYGRAPGREFKRSHIEVVLKETPAEEKKSRGSKSSATTKKQEKETKHQKETQQLKENQRTSEMKTESAPEDKETGPEHKEEQTGQQEAVKKETRKGDENSGVANPDKGESTKDETEPEKEERNKEEPGTKEGASEETEQKSQDKKETSQDKKETDKGTKESDKETNNKTNKEGAREK